MMTELTKAITTIGMALVLSLALAACGGDDEEPEAAPTPTPTPTAVPFQPSATEEAEDDAAASASTYAVESGDTLSSIAARFDTSISAIVELNELDDADTLAIGDELLIPGSSAAAADSDDAGSDDVDDSGVGTAPEDTPATDS